MHSEIEPAMVSALYDLRLIRQMVEAAASVDPEGPPLWRRVWPHRSEPPRRLGLLAGSFNPPTMAHLALATAAREAGLIDELSLTISKVTVDKEAVTRAALADRLLVLSQITERLNAAEDGRALLSVALVNRGLYADQAVAARAALPHLERLYFVVGFDKIVQVMDPRYYDDRDTTLDRLFSLASFLVAPRAGHGPTELDELVNLPQNRRYRGRVSALPLPAEYASHSSSAARAGNRAAGYLPPEAARFIFETHPYAEAFQQTADDAPMDSYATRWVVLERLLAEGVSVSTDEVRRLYRAACDSEEPRAVGRST